MWAAHGTVVLPAGCEAEPLAGASIKQVLEAYRTMWKEDLIPQSTKTDPGDHVLDVFRSGKIGMQAGANYIVPRLKETASNLDFGVAFLPGPGQGEVSSFAGGDVLTIPAGGKHAAKALEFLSWIPGKMHPTSMQRLEICLRGPISPEINTSPPIQADQGSGSPGHRSDPVDIPFQRNGKRQCKSMD